MKKPWSITTTVRNPERLRDFLLVLQELNGEEWNHDNQIKYQILLIQHRKYGYRQQQFYKGLPQQWVDLIDDLSMSITFEFAEKILHIKRYEDPAMRGRNSLNPLKKMGLAAIQNGRLQITDAGISFLKSDYDYEEVFFKSLMKWQIPNPNSRDYPKSGGYDIKPFIGTLHLVNIVNRKETERGHTAKGISKREFSLFAPTLVHYQDVEDYAERIIELRDMLSDVVQQDRNEKFADYERDFASEFLETDDQTKVDKLLKNLKDYGDNVIRYFRLTRYFYIRGNGYYVDLEPRRSVEIDSLLDQDNAQSEPFTSKAVYEAYISDMAKPQLPWETREKYIQITASILEEIRSLEISLEKTAIVIDDFRAMTTDILKLFISDMRNYRQQLQDEKLRKESQDMAQIGRYIHTLEHIRDYEQRPILLEKLASLCLNALNDAIAIQPNYPVGDDNEPTFTAPANTPDIECFYENYNAICEVTMLTGRNQWYSEGQPVMRHFRDFEDKHNDKPSYCLFISPSLHRDTLNTFWMSVKYEYEGRAQKIIPLSISNFVQILEVLRQMKVAEKFLTHVQLSSLFDDILANSIVLDDSIRWFKSIPIAINSWRISLLEQT